MFPFFYGGEDDRLAACLKGGGTLGPDCTTALLGVGLGLNSTDDIFLLGMLSSLLTPAGSSDSYKEIALLLSSEVTSSLSLPAATASWNQAMMKCRFSVMTSGDIPISSSSLSRASQVSWSFRTAILNVYVEIIERSRFPERTSTIKRFNLVLSLIYEDL